MSRNVLLVEPDYPTKFPPLGLMKISAYHKELGDNVYFVKGKKFHGGLFDDKYWDRIYITTLFTYNWKITVDTIYFYKDYILHGDISRIFVGGIMAGLMSDELWKETGIKPIKGILNKAGMFGDKNNFIVDDMIPDYELFDDTPNEYNLLDNYMGYTTRGCKHKCGFCGVHILEPKFIEYKGLKPYVKKIDELYGEKQHLILFDNNVLASKQFEQIIHDIMDLGFKKGSKRNNRLRYVDFNQGTDARLMKEKHIKLLSQIELNPLRIAFDHIKEKERYCKKIRLAAKYDIHRLSNYILYNYNDTPYDLWQRLKINIDLNKECDLKIYSFPMKYIPLDAKDRSYINELNWNWQYLRNVHRVLNVLKGTVMTSEDFFYRAFGENEEEFMTILHMPERILMYRGRKPKSEEKEWINKFNKLKKNEKKELLNILCENRSRKTLIKVFNETSNAKLKKILEYYLPEGKAEKEPLPLFNKLKKKGNIHA